MDVKVYFCFYTFWIPECQCGVSNFNNRAEFLFFFTTARTQLSVNTFTVQQDWSITLSTPGVTELNGMPFLQSMHLPVGRNVLYRKNVVTFWPVLWEWSWWRHVAPFSVFCCVHRYWTLLSAFHHNSRMETKTIVNLWCDQTPHKKWSSCTEEHHSLQITRETVFCTLLVLYCIACTYTCKREITLETFMLKSECRPSINKLSNYSQINTLFVG